MSDAITLGNIALSEGSSRPERRDAAANRELILETAQRLFAERGVAEVNMTEIAEAAGVGKGTLYRRFANKGDLCLALMDDQLTSFQNELLDQMRQMSAEGISRLEQLAHFLDRLVYFNETHMPLLSEVQAEGLVSGGRIGLPHFWHYLTISGLLQAAITAGEVPASLDVAFTADALLAPLTASFYSFHRVQRGFPPERVSAGLRSLVEGLRIRHG
jgi:AcrR family transcriptional regulator